MSLSSVLSKFDPIQPTPMQPDPINPDKIGPLPPSPSTDERHTCTRQRRARCSGLRRAPRGWCYIRPRIVHARTPPLPLARPLPGPNGHPLFARWQESWGKSNAEVQAGVRRRCQVAFGSQNTCKYVLTVQHHLSDLSRSFACPLLASLSVSANSCLFRAFCVHLGNRETHRMMMTEQ